MSEPHAVAVFKREFLIEVTLPSIGAGDGFDGAARCRKRTVIY